jgi:hypothetical protein
VKSEEWQNICSLLFGAGGGLAIWLSVQSERIQRT